MSGGVPFEEELLEIELYLTPQVAGPEDDQLHCMFCHTGHRVAWETHYRPQGTGTLIGAGVCETCRTKLKPIRPPTPPNSFIHVDDFIDDFRGPAYPRFVLNYFRHSASLHNAFEPFMRAHELYCDWQDKRWRVTGASRLGDVWLTQDFNQVTGYQARVNVAECSGWGCKP